MYTAPEWNVATSKSGYLEVLKEGKMIEKIGIDAGSTFVSFGRLPDNTVPLEHDSISRKHAVLWFGPNNTSFVFDLDSTHGTFLNKKALPPQKYVKITSGNDLIQFGASSRFFMLFLEEDIIDKVIKEISSERTEVLNFFSARKISQNSISIIRTGKLVTCSIDFSEFISINSSESLTITSSATTKEEAMKFFFEDSFKFLLRFNLIDNCLEDSDNESDFSSDEFYTKKDSDKLSSSKDALSESQILILRNQLKNEIDLIQNEINVFKSNKFALESEIVDDFDVYISEVKITEIEADIEKLQQKLEISENEFSKYGQILKIIGYKESKSDSENPEINDYNFDCVQASQFGSDDKIRKNKIGVKKLKSLQAPIVTQIEDDNDTDFVKFEDATLIEDTNAVNIDVLKRKYGY